MKKILATLVLILFVLSLSATVIASTLTVSFDDGHTATVGGEQAGGGAWHYYVTHSGSKVMSATAYVYGEDPVAWKGQGSENADRSDCLSATWHWVLTPKPLLTISDVSCTPPPDNGDNGNGEENGNDENGDDSGNDDENGNDNGDDNGTPEKPKPKPPVIIVPTPPITVIVETPGGATWIVPQATQPLPQTDGGNLRSALGFIGLFILACFVIYGLVMWENKEQ